MCSAEAARVRRLRGLVRLSRDCERGRRVCEQGECQTGTLRVLVLTMCCVEPKCVFPSAPDACMRGEPPSCV